MCVGLSGARRVCVRIRREISTNPLAIADQISGVPMMSMRSTEIVAVSDDLGLVGENLLQFRRQARVIAEEDKRRVSVDHFSVLSHRALRVRLHLRWFLGPERGIRFDDR